MLVLTRKLRESIVINGNITVTVVDVRGDRVQLGIDAPQDVSVHREEVSKKIESETKRLGPEHDPLKYRNKPDDQED